MAPFASEKPNADSWQGVQGDGWIGPGSILGRCQLVSQIGEGSMGTVWKAWHTTLGISVAVKILRPCRDREAEIRALQRFRQEAHIASRADHPSLVRVLDYGEDHHRPYLVMELVRGPTLEEWMRQAPVCEERTALKVAGHIGIGLANLHQLGVVHRDIKPSNILIHPGRHVKISDLGLAGSPVGLDGQLAGTPHYLAPECVLRGCHDDARSDLYAVGVILYRLLLGRLPFEGSTKAILHAQAWERPDWTIPEGVRLDAGTLYVVRRLLEKEPLRRMQSALELIQACREQVHRLDRREQMASDTPVSVAPESMRIPVDKNRTTRLPVREAGRFRRGFERVVRWLSRTFAP
ncbi:MAG: serine/threonine protein kinase [Fibrobacteres bacterium]|jgi:serine/threonine protein kinase|nr:serine/threonine protein kinase [Fibrobacterota bacterium]